MKLRGQATSRIPQQTYPEHSNTSGYAKANHLAKGLKPHGTGSPERGIEMPRKPNYLNPDTDQDLQVRPLDLVYPGFLSRRDMKRLARCTTELKEVAVERPKYIDIALDENLKYLLRTIPAARRHQDELQQLFAEIFCEVKRYGHLYHKIQETLKGETGTVAVISEWAQWIDGTVYEINQPEGEDHADPIKLGTDDRIAVTSRVSDDRSRPPERRHDNNTMAVLA